MNRYVAAIVGGAVLGVLAGTAVFVVQVLLSDGQPQHLPPKGIHL